MDTYRRISPVKSGLATAGGYVAIKTVPRAHFYLDEHKAKFDVSFPHLSGADARNAFVLGVGSAAGAAAHNAYHERRGRNARRRAHR